MATSSRTGRLALACQIREGDEVQFSTRDKARKVTQVVRTKEDPTHVEIILASGGRRTFLLEDQVIRLDPKPDTQRRGR